LKKNGTLNQPISAVIAGMGHGDLLVIADCGLPIPPGVLRIDLALTAGIPSFLETLTVVQQEMQVESAVIAQEMTSASSKLYHELSGLFATTPLDMISHCEFKKLTSRAVAVIRTGECTPYANIILKSGVIF
jgi:D-ribose pyranase